MIDQTKTAFLSAEEAAAQATVNVAASGIRYAMLGELRAPHTTPEELKRLVDAVPVRIAAELKNTTYVFVPLAMSGARLAGEDLSDAKIQASDKTLIAPVSSPELADQAICHRNASIGNAEYVFLSAEMHSDKFALAFELFINVAHDLGDVAATPESFASLLEQQVRAGVRGETSVDAWESRTRAFGLPPDGAGRSVLHRETDRLLSSTESSPEKARQRYMDAAYSDAVAIYLLSLYLDFDYADLREREYPLLSAPALAARLRAVSALYPANAGYNFSILYRRRG